jgi:hydroxymethylpyrimidine/phosphomethylpyrimidine kinase
LKMNAIEELKSQLITFSYLVTPNIFEAEILAEMKIKNLQDVRIAAQKIQKIGVKNVDKILNYLLKENGEEKIFTNKKLPFKNIHGTGCTLASAISCFLSQKLDLEKAVKKANSFVYLAIKNSQKIGLGSRILKHF